MARVDLGSFTASCPQYTLRLLFFDQDNEVLAIEFADAPNGGSNCSNWFAAAAPIASDFTFDLSPG